MSNNVLDDNDFRLKFEVNRIKKGLPPLYSDFRQEAEKLYSEMNANECINNSISSENDCCFDTTNNIHLNNNYYNVCYSDDKKKKSGLVLDDIQKDKLKSLFCLFNNSSGSKEVELYDGNKNNDCSLAVKEDCLSVVKDSFVVKDSSSSVVSYDLDNDKFFVEETSVLKKDFNRKDLQNANILKLMRATDKDRNEIIDILQKSSVNGQLDEEEFEYRTGLVLESKTLKQLEIITQDLLSIKPSSLKNVHVLNGSVSHSNIKKSVSDVKAVKDISKSGSSGSNVSKPLTSYPSDEDYLLRYSYRNSYGSYAPVWDFLGTSLFLVVIVVCFMFGIFGLKYLDFSYFASSESEHVKLITKVAVKSDYSKDGRVVVLVPEKVFHDKNKFVVRFFRKDETGSLLEVKRKLKDYGDNYFVRLPAGSYVAEADNYGMRSSVSFVVKPKSQSKKVTFFR